MALSMKEIRDELRHLSNRHDCLVDDYKHLREMFDAQNTELIQRREEVKVLLRLIRNKE